MRNPENSYFRMPTWILAPTSLGLYTPTGETVVAEAVPAVSACGYTEGLSGCPATVSTEESEVASPLKLPGPVKHSPGRPGFSPTRSVLTRSGEPHTRVAATVLAAC